MNQPNLLTRRLFLCDRCNRQVMICSQCDRGNRYCSQQCATAARCQSLREAGNRYQGSRRGKAKHAERQSRYRARARSLSRDKKVTHQGSTPVDCDASLKLSQPDNQARARSVKRSDYQQSRQLTESAPRCDFCARPCSVFVRTNTLRRYARREPLHPSGP